MTPEQYIKGRMAAYAIDEGAMHGSADNIAAIAHVLKNRVDAGWHGGDWMRVIETAGSQVGTVYEAEPVNLRVPQVRQFLIRADDIFRGDEEDFIAGALYYCELHDLNREWFRENITSQIADHPRIATVGLVAFFR